MIRPAACRVAASTSTSPIRYTLIPYGGKPSSRYRSSASCFISVSSESGCPDPSGDGLGPRGVAELSCQGAGTGFVVVGNPSVLERPIVAHERVRGARVSVEWHPDA